MRTYIDTNHNIKMLFPPQNVCVVVFTSFFTTWIKMAWWGVVNPFTAKIASSRTKLSPTFCSFHLEISNGDTTRASSSSSRITVTNL